MPEYIPSRPVVSLGALLDIQKLAFPHPGLFSFARYALIYYLAYLSETGRKKIRTVLLPDYMCHEVANALREYGYQVSYYALGPDFAFPPRLLEELSKERDPCDAMVVGHFYGKICPDMDTISTACRERGIVTIEDCVHLPFPYHAEMSGSLSDAKLFTLRKVYPVPHGAAILLKEGQEDFSRYVRSRVPVRYREGIGEALGWAWRQFAKKALQLARLGYTLPYRDIANDPLKPFTHASPGVPSLLSMRNFHQAVAARRHNYERYLRDLPVFEPWGSVLRFDLERDVPYMFLIYLTEGHDAQALVQSLMKQAIPAVLGLALDPCVVARLAPSHVYNRILCLPLHQDIHEGHIQYIVRVLSQHRSHSQLAESRRCEMAS